MTQTVNIRKGEKVFRVNFMYNNDLINIMRAHNGWYFGKEKAWQFPLWKFDKLYDELTDKRYNVKILKLEIKKAEPKPFVKMKFEDYWEDKNVVSVPGHCKKCGEWHFLGKDRLCVRCR